MEASSTPPVARVRKASKSTGDDPRRSFTLRMKQSDYDALRLRARASGRTMSLYLTECLRPPVEQVDPEALRELSASLRELVAQIKGEATNINQLAYWANSHRQFPGEAEEVSALLRMQARRINTLRMQIAELL